EMLDAEPEHLEGPGIPALRPLVEEARARRHRDARAELTEEPKPKILAEGYPAPGGAKRRGIALPEPPEPRREIGGVEAAADSRVVRLLVDPRTEFLHGAGAARIRPRIDRGGRTVVRSEAEDGVPEGACGDAGHAGGSRPHRRQEAIECLGR